MNPYNENCDISTWNLVQFCLRVHWFTPLFFSGLVAQRYLSTISEVSRLNELLNSEYINGYTIHQLGKVQLILLSSGLRSSV